MGRGEIGDRRVTLQRPPDSELPNSMVSPPVALHSLFMGRLAVSTHGAEAAKVPTHGASSGCALNAVGSPVWGAKQRPIKK